jgi:anti-sigma regulatory factor (Ser/Thr protein kinase)
VLTGTAMREDRPPMSPAQGADGHQPLRTNLVPMPVQRLITGLRVQVDATVTAPNTVRNRVRRWLTDHHWPEESAADCVLAVSEAVTNSVEHGYGITGHSGAPPGGSVTVDGHLARTDHHYQAVFEVRDQGRWQAAPPDRQHGFSWSIMRNCMEDVRVDRSDQGTTVFLWSRPATPRIDGARDGHD